MKVGEGDKRGLLTEIEALEKKAPGLDDLHHAFGGVFADYLSEALKNLRIREVFHPILLDPWNIGDPKSFVVSNNISFHQLFELQQDMRAFMCELRRRYMCDIDEIIDYAGPHLPSSLSYSEKSLVLLYILNRMCEAQNDLLEKLVSSSDISRDVYDH